MNDLSIKLTLAGNAASKIIDKYGITSSEHIRLRDIAFREGAFVIEEPVARATASLVKSKNGATIRISPFDRPERKRFSIAHELGHLKLNHVAGKLQKACTEKDMRSWYKKSIETEAYNFFKGKELYKEPIEVKANSWFDNDKDDEYIVEHSIGSHEFDSVLTLLWIRP